VYVNFPHFKYLLIAPIGDFVINSSISEKIFDLLSVTLKEIVILSYTNFLNLFDANSLNLMFVL